MVNCEFYEDKIDDQDVMLMRLSSKYQRYIFNLDKVFPMTQKQLELFKSIFVQCESDKMYRLCDWLESKAPGQKPAVIKRIYNNIEFFKRLKYVDQIVCTIHVRKNFLKTC